MSVLAGRTGCALDGRSLAATATRRRR